MPLIKDSMIAWHDALATREGVQDPFNPSIASTAPGGHAEVYDASLSPVRRCIKGMKAPLRDAGNWCYGPDVNAKYRNRVMQMLWVRYQEKNGALFISSINSTNKVSIMVSAATECLAYRARNDGEAKLSHSEVAKRMGINRSSFSETWKESYEEMINWCHGLAREALAILEPVVHELNQQDRKAG